VGRKSIRPVASQRSYEKIRGGKDRAITVSLCKMVRTGGERRGKGEGRVHAQLDDFPLSDLKGEAHAGRGGKKGKDILARTYHKEGGGQLLVHI